MRAAPIGWAIAIAVAGDTLGGQTPTGGSVGQQPGPAASIDITKTDDFRTLFQEREVLLTRLSGLRKSIPELQARATGVRDTATLKNDLERAQRDLGDERSASRPDTARVAAITRFIVSTQRDLDFARTTIPELRKAEADLESDGRRLFSLEQRIASLFDATRDTNRFRSTVTVTFGVLVSVVILGFYVIAWNKEGVARTIFSGEMGMQFVTLFLIVIAIILFGIMGTLEGRELAALLGGLSGYILGRASDGRKSAVPVETDSSRKSSTPAASAG